MGWFAIVVEGPALPERGCRGVEAPVVVPEKLGRRVEREVLVRREGSWGSGAMAPSFCRSRILKSRRLIWRSSWVFVLIGAGGKGKDGDGLTRRACFSARETFSS